MLHGPARIEGLAQVDDEPCPFIVRQPPIELDRAIDAERKTEKGTRRVLRNGVDAARRLTITRGAMPTSRPISSSSASVMPTAAGTPRRTVSGPSDARWKMAATSASLYRRSVMRRNVSSHLLFNFDLTSAIQFETITTRHVC
ncbi:MAG: hypothetical protein H0W30_08350 [Gemmatimonadaceae bacterium]|nr:hypothetical protein [Gemmatimonadaceae bacterium]MDQ3517947.1 hypothetical protein [Gemmatimonadota bacterium]